MSDPRNVAHAKKVTQEKKHHGTQAQGDTPAAQPGKKSAAKKNVGGVEAASVPDVAPAADNVVPGESPASKPQALEGSLVVLTKLKEMEFHSRATLERLAELVMTVEDELKQAEIVSPLNEVYSAQNIVQTKLTAVIEAYKAECDRLQGQSV